MSPPATPIVSVIVPCYKQARFLPECLRSLQAQSLRQWEMVIVNDGSPDDTELVAKGLMREDDRVRLINQANRGLPAARNAGLRVMRGRYIQFLDADDLLGSTKLEWHVGLLEAQRDVALVYGNAWYFFDAEPRRRIRQGFGPDPEKDWIADLAARPGPLLHRLIERNLMPVCSPLFRRSLFDAAGPVDESLRALEDWEYWIRCANTGARFLFDPAVEGESFVRLHATSMSQDRALMHSNGLKMRLRTMLYLRPAHARRLMLARIGNEMTWHKVTDRDPIYGELSKAARGFEERIAIGIARRFGPHRPGHTVLAPVLRHLPWHMRALSWGG